MNCGLKHNCLMHDYLIIHLLPNVGWCDHGVMLPECYSCIIFFASVSGYLDLSGPYFNIARCSSMGMGENAIGIRWRK